jgi:hypothetical protein
MTDDAATNTNGGRTGPSRRAAYLLLLIPFIALLWVPFYAAATPTAAGMTTMPVSAVLMRHPTAGR